MSGMTCKESSKLTIVNSSITNTSSNNVVIWLGDNATAEIKSGTITSAANVINNTSNTSTVILGEKDGNVKDDLKLITETTYPSVYNNGILYYYDGTIKGKTALTGGVCEIEENTYIDLSIEEGFEIASLKPVEYVAEVTNAELTNEKCKTLKEAIEKCSNTANSTIKIIKDFTIDEENKAIIESTQDIILDLNGHTITGFTTVSILENNGTLKITDLSDEKSGKIISRGNTIIENIGTLEFENATMQINKSGTSSNYNYVINNSGAFTMNSGTLTMANISNVRTLENKLNGTIEINGGNITAYNGNYAIYSESTETITLNASNINGNRAYAIYNNGAGKIIVDGATITSLDSDSRYWYSCYGMYNKNGIIEIKSGTITANGYYGINNNSGTIIMSGGRIEGNYYGIENESGNITVTGGTIVSKNGYAASHSGIYNNTGTITLGEKLGGVSTESPRIISNGNSYGINNQNGIFNFYDGIIEAKQGYSIYGSKSDIEEDYNIITYKNGESDEFPVDSGYEKTILKQIEVARINDTTYSSVVKAFEEAEDGDTIVILTNASISETQNTIEIASGDTITLDLAGYTVSSAKNTSIINSGNFEIIDSSTAKTGQFINTSGKVCENLAGAKLTLTSGTVQVNNSNALINKGDFILQGGKLISRSTNNVIQNEEAGNITVTSGNIDSYGEIYSNSTGKIKISGGTIDLTSNDIEILNSETVEITGGKLTQIGSYSRGIMAKGNAKVYISGNQTEINESMYFYNNAYLEVNGGTINKMIQLNDTTTAVINDGTINDGYSIRTYSTGDITINGGTVSGELDNCVKNNVVINGGSIGSITNHNYSGVAGTITINGGTIQNDSEYSNGVGITNENGGTIIINDVTIKTKQHGIKNSGTIIFGKENGETNPKITSSANYGVYNYGGTFKFYSGTITGKDEAIRGFVTEIPENKSIILSKDGNIETATLESNIKIAKIGEVEYTNLNTAIEEFDENTDDEITIVNDFAITENDKVAIGENKDVIINLNRHIITTMSASSAITNNGTLKLINSNGNGTISSRSQTIINNLGTMEIDGGTYTSSTNTNYLIVNKGDFTLTSGNVTSSRYAVQNDSLGNMWLNGGNIILSSTTSGGYAIYNQSGKIYINNNAVIDAGGYYGMTAIQNEQAGEVEINGGTILSGDSIYNNGTITINGGTIEIETSGRYISNGSYANLKMTGGTIKSNGSGIETSSSNPVIIEGGTIIAKENAIRNDGNNSTSIQITGGTIISQNSTAISNSRKYWGQQRLVITGGTITSETAIGIENSGILVLGKDDDEVPSLTNPEIIGKTYGIKNTGTCNFYDGIVKGESLAIDGEITETPYGYKVITNDENTEAYLGIMPEVDKPVILNGNNMDSLEIAMQTLSNFENKVGTIVLRKNITLTETLVIPSDVAVTFVLQGHAITYNGSEATIENNGTLTVVDYQDPEESLDAGDASIIRNIGEGTAIENNGTLTLGASGGQTNANSPVISGGVTGNAPTIYDGKVE